MPEDRRKTRVAVASSDGKVVNRHFGHTDRFLIFESHGEGFTFIEARDNAPVCNGGTHDDDALTRAAEIISDCSYLIAVKVGAQAAGVLLRKRIRVFMDGDFMDKSLEKLAKSGKLKYLPRK
jgi:nitrogen fixation protein NifX